MRHPRDAQRATASHAVSRVSTRRKSAATIIADVVKVWIVMHVSACELGRHSSVAMSATAGCYQHLDTDLLARVLDGFSLVVEVRDGRK